MMELIQPKQTVTEPNGLRGSGWIIAGFYLFAALAFTSWAMGTGGPIPAPSHHTSTSSAASSAATTGSAPTR